MASVGNSSIPNPQEIAANVISVDWFKGKSAFEPLIFQEKPMDPMVKIVKPDWIFPD